MLLTLLDSLCILEKIFLNIFYRTDKLQHKYKTETISYSYKLSFFENVSRSRPCANLFTYKEKAILHNMYT